ncbi:MAG: hypothetical protein CMF52_02980 [Legionellales bacterium]|nr:hypothetical protein [Legionellales bacterium]
MSSEKEILDFLDGIAPTTNTTEVSIGDGDAFNDGAAGVPSMGAPLKTVTLPNEGEEVLFGKGKLVYYGQGGRKFFGFYSDMNVVRDGVTVTLTGTLKEE